VRIVSLNLITTMQIINH